ncbi:membrane hypothetical protein [uncultured Paludibacter sp.]|nr:membrane hypothetical protein [uncultured Paludibacter sp.]
MLKDKTHIIITSFLILMSVFFILLADIFLNSKILNNYPLVLYLFILGMWWNGDKYAKLILRFTFIILSLIALFLYFDVLNFPLERLNTFKNRFFFFFGHQTFTLIFYFILIYTFCLFIVNPTYKNKFSAKTIKHIAQGVITCMWIFTGLIILEQTYFFINHNVDRVVFTNWLKDQKLFILRDFMYGGMKYLLNFTDTVFKILLFIFILSTRIFIKNTLQKTFKGIHSKIILIICLIGIFASAINHYITNFIFEMSVIIIYYQTLNNTFRETDSFLMDKLSFYTNYSDRKILKFWLGAIILIPSINFIYSIASLSYSNFYVFARILSIITFAVFTTIVINIYLKKLELVLNSKNEK